MSLARWFETEALARMATYRASDHRPKGLEAGGLSGKARFAGTTRSTGGLQPPVPQGRQDLPDLLDPSEIQLREGDPDLVRGLGH
jgi:hypothetical protein